jgi:diguanylate cyclase (GGDEF)-like protein
VNSVNIPENKSLLIQIDEKNDLKEILKIERISGLLEKFCRVTGLSSAILDLNGNILLEVGWKSICSQFHRKDKTTSIRCKKSDEILADRLKKNAKYATCICQNGLVDAATPITIDKVHVANLFIGQFFFKSPDKDLFIRQAEEFGFSREKYLKALDECQVYNKQTIVKMLDFLHAIIEVINESAQKTIKLKEQNKDKKARSADLRNANEEIDFQKEEITFTDCHDKLTGLYNRNFFEEEKKRLNTERQLPVSIVVGDVNGLKLINYGFGHEKGDEVLVEVTKILKKCCREKDIISRIGGGEFSIFLPRTDSQAAQKVCTRIYAACKGCTLLGSKIYPSISLGYATKMTEKQTLDDILMAAEKSMSKKKLLERESAHNAIIASLKAIMFEKSQNTEEHAGRMVQLSRAIGLDMSLSDDQLNELALLTILHDIGKVSVPTAILSKKGKLSDEEWAIIRRHPEAGFRIAQASSDLAPIANYILCHHERWDGKGYPQGLSGIEIPLLSRIVAVVDSFDAMTNDRSYRTAMSKEEAIEEIRKNSGTQFDPEISQLFIKLISQGTDNHLPLATSPDDTLPPLAVTHDDTLLKTYAKI